MSACRSQKKLRLQKWTIDSRDRDEGTSHNFSFRFPNGMRLATGGWARVTAVTIPMSYHGLELGYNTIIPFSGPAWASTVAIPQGNYATPANLASAVQDAIQLLDGSLTCVWLEDVMRFQIEHPTDLFTLTWGSDPTSGRNAAVALGFEPDTDVGPLSQIESNRHPSFGDPTGFDIRSTALTRGTFSAIKTKLLGSRSLVRIPNAGTRAGLLHWASLEDSGRDLAQLKAPDGGVQLDEIDISIWTAGDDHEARNIDLRGGDVVIELEIAGLE